MMHPPKTILFWHINTLCVHLKTDAQMPNPEQGQICMETSSGVLIRPEDLLTRFSPRDETRVPHLVPESKSESHQWNHPAPRSPKKKKL